MFCYTFLIRIDLRRNASSLRRVLCTNNSDLSSSIHNVCNANRLMKTCHEARGLAPLKLGPITQTIT